MTSELLDKLTDGLADEVVAKVGPKLLAYLDARRTEKLDDPLLNTKQVAARLSVSETKVRELVSGGYLSRTKGMIDIRIRQSVVDAYGK